MTMTKVLLRVWGYRCERCEHEWVPRESTTEPRVCPKCKSPYWNKPRRSAQAVEKRPEVPTQEVSV